MKDRLRQEFEAWKREQGADIDPWTAWQASRAGISIKLPAKDVWAEAINREACAWNNAIDECKSSIEMAGLKVS
jgi:hypothetical protein